LLFSHAGSGEIDHPALGFAKADVQVFKSAPRKGNLVVRLRGIGRARLSTPTVCESLKSWSLP
jgi:hypothetical protein